MDKRFQERRREAGRFKFYNTWLKGDTIKFKNLSEHRVVPEFIVSLNRLTKKFDRKHVVLDFMDVERVSASPLAPLAGCIEYYKSQGVEFEAINIPSYLYHSRFMSPIVPDDATIRNTHSFLDKVWAFSNSTEVFALTDGIISSIRKSAECEHGVLQSCEWGINEIMDNVIQHSEMKRGFVMAQIAKSSKYFNICIFDYGVGIYNTMKGVSPHIRNAVDAISYSVKEGVKGTRSTGQGNGMWGLYNIVNENSGHMTIVSGAGGLYFAQNRTKSLIDQALLNRTQHATSINFHLHLNKETLLEKAIKGYTFPNLYIENLEDSDDRIVYTINKIASGTGTRESAEQIRNELMNIYSDSKRPIWVDFSGVGIISSSFADELIAKLIVKLGFYQYQKIFQLVNMNPTVQTILHRSIAQRFYEDFSKSMG